MPIKINGYVYIPPGMSKVVVGTADGAGKIVYQKITGYTYTVDISTTNCTSNFNFPYSALLPYDTQIISLLWTELFGYSNEGLVFFPSFQEGKATIFAYAYIETAEEALLLEWDNTHANGVKTINGQVGAYISEEEFSSSDTISYTDTPLIGSFDYDKYNLTNHEYSLNYAVNATRETTITATTFTSDIGISSHLYDTMLAANNISVKLDILYDGYKETGDYILHPSDTSLKTLWQLGSGAQLIRIQGKIDRGNLLTGKQLVFSVRAGRGAGTHTFSVAIKSIIIY